MDQMILKSQFLKKLTKFVIVSIWVCSIFFSHNFYFSRFSIRLVTHTIDKNYMFLFCNGLVVFVAKYSGLINSKSREESSGKIDKSFDHRAFQSYNTNGITEYELVQRRHTELFLVEEVTKTGEHRSETVSENLESVEEHEKDIYVVREDQYSEEEEEEEDEEEEEEEEDDDDDCEFDGGIEEEEKNDEENEGVMTAEELNKKFDEFIRKRKEELRIEARRHLIAV